MKDLIESLIIINLLTFFMYGLDKFLAKKHLLRIPEVVLLFFSLIGAPLGSIIGMKLFHHKTKKIKFWIFNIITFIIYTYIFMKTVGV